MPLWGPHAYAMLNRRLMAPAKVLAALAMLASTLWGSAGVGGAEACIECEQRSTLLFGKHMIHTKNRLTKTTTQTMRHHLWPGR